MHPRVMTGSGARRSRVAQGRGRLMMVLTPGALIVALIAGCSAASGSGTAGTHGNFTSCGRTRTAANVPVDVEITGDHLTCNMAMSVERKYADAIRLGQAPGNGGGGPVKVEGWTCQGFATPVVLRTGKTSKCVDNSNEILEILPSPS